MTALLTIDDIARMWGVSRRHARDVLVKSPDFPKPAPGSTARLKRWSLGAVQDYILSEPAPAKVQGGGA